MSPDLVMEGEALYECDDVMPRLYEFIDNELDLGELEAMRDHMDGCESCTYEHDVRVKLKSVVREGCFEPAPEALKARVAANIAQLRQKFDQLGG